MVDKRKAAPSLDGDDSPKRARSAVYEDNNVADGHSSSKANSRKRGIQPQLQPKNDSRFGQKFAFPDLDEDKKSDGNGALPYDEDETMNGLTYLRMVRSQAESLPLVLDGISKESATGEETNEEKFVHDEACPGGFYSDGAFIARSVTTQAKGLQTLDEEQAPDPQEKYYMLLGERFEMLRSILRRTPPATMIASLGDEHPIHFPRSNKAAKREWTKTLESTEPKMTQLACMDMDSVRGVMGIITNIMQSTIRNRDMTMLRRLGAWVWGVLGRCREVGELSSDEVADIRQLGKEAAKNLLLIREMDREDLYAQDEGEGTAPRAESESDLESIYLPDDFATKQPPTGSTGEVCGDESEMTRSNENNDGANLGDSSAFNDRDNKVLQENGAQQSETQPAVDKPPSAIFEDEERNGGYEEDAEEVGRQEHKRDEFEDQNQDYSDEDYEVDTHIRAMLDMILSIVGEFYGQRDLLGSRDIWDEDVVA